MNVPLRVRDYMTADVLTVSPRDEITQVVQLLIERDISGVVVVDEDSVVVGILTERDCIAVAASAGYFDEWGGPVDSYMSTPVETAGPDDNLVDVAERMTHSQYRRFPVIENGKLIGIIGRRDVLRALNSGSWFVKRG